MSKIVFCPKQTKKLQDIIAQVTFPTKKETALHYCVVFTDNASYWRVFKPDVPGNVRVAILDKVK